MKKILGLLSILALAFGLAFAACGGDDGDNGDGKDAPETPGADVETPGADAETPGVDTDGCDPVLNCADKECGDDGCAGTCGMCPPNVACLPDGKCKVEVCVPKCDGKDCGPDGCGADCGTCADGETCNPISQLCDVIKNPCLDKQCGTWEGEWCGECPCADCAEDQVDCNAETGMCIAGITPDEECPAIYDCVYDCPPGDSGCMQNCINEASIDAQMAFNNLEQCRDDVGLWDCFDLCPEDAIYISDCGDEAMACYDEKSALCEEEYYACYIPGDLTCEEIFDCFDTCPDDDSPCKQNCYQDGTIEAQKTATAMWDCYEDEGVYDCWDLCPADAQSISQCPPEGQECFDETLGLCQDATNACFPPGFLSCADTGLCIESCPAGAPDCPQECVAAGTAPAQDAFWKLQECILSECGEGSTAECQAYAIEGPCKDAFDACVGG